MKLLLDANVEGLLAKWLAATGHDVLWAVALPPRTSDKALVELANAEGRAILTHDLGFGEMVFRERVKSPGIALMRYSTPWEAERLALLQGQWSEIEGYLGEGLFVVVTEKGVRPRPFPTAGSG